ncbi:nitrogen fixation protein NifZ [Vibrio agarivorans]|uniref:nitrogen fixation protein NifZ n=1 Tax=Vibrio agarivorans TaxID=153622 RepID=UPI00222FD8C7|nr:nitrogen fixation protein NifZ [Vibrio agarivorans]MDN3663414.1 nitrogen fixation protein NifZ [Vibrio agarivorans]
MYREARFEIGDEVRVSRTIRNDGTFSHAMPKGEVLVSSGSTGFVRSLGYFLQNQIIYRVYFPDVDREVGVRSNELLSASLEWEPNPYHLKQKVRLTTSLGHNGQLLAKKGDVVEIVKMERDLAKGHVNFMVLVNAHWVWLRNAALEEITSPVKQATVVE